VGFQFWFFHEEESFTMRYCIAVGASLAMTLLIGCVLADEALKSGPQVGDSLSPFNPLNVTGDNAGEKVCQV
jgi:hypothetical protein